MSDHVPVEYTKAANFRQIVARIFAIMEPLPCTTSSCENGRTKFSEKLVHEAERDPVLMITAINGIFGRCIEHVVHPPHVPLEAETEPAQIGRS